MSRLHTVRASIADIARHFDAEPAAGLLVPEETREGLPGLVVLESKGRRILRRMDWGFPRLTREARLRGEEAGRIGLVADLTNSMWDTMVVDTRYRCLVVLTHFANPEGVPRAKTRTWFSVHGEPILTWAGFCRKTPEFGPVYAGMTMEANAAIPPTNDRMPVLLERDEYDQWLHGGIEDVIRFQFRPPFAAERMKVDHTDDLWGSGVAPPATERQFALL
ncbi:SOS response-associated peptidase family protein [Sphingomonas oryzagri]|uniref:SOS response-associated peptidase family protein n=1 Tax=Sphingomonas oryzagri TaxID=3042314 RepID=A0ABT6N2I3_9SPHN|nr:SOS response-associated peptidase family protein [Sphingomonas oryzagri]MDH7639272.1 SOS response-associated peptidase family protein [Sphingomonas oryzagri]